MATNKSVADVYLRAKALLNDRSGVFWTDAKLLEHVKSAYTWASNEILRVTGSQKEKKVSLTYTTPAADLISITPADMYLPEKLDWRLNTSEEWREVNRVDSLPARDGSGAMLSELCEWEFRDRNIYVNPSSQSGLVRLTYTGLIADVTSSASPILYDNLVETLAYYAAAQARISRGQNTAGLALLGDKAERIGALGFMEQVTDLLVHNEQLVPRRGMPFSGRTRL
jgi:hypothetical protein